MTPLAVERLLDSLARIPKEASRSTRIRAEADGFLRAPEGIGHVLRAALKAAPEPRRDIAADLLSATLDVARMAAENGSPDGTRLLALVAQGVKGMEAAGELGVPERIRLAQVHARAELDPPPEAILRPEALAGTPPPIEEGMPDVGAMLTAVLSHVGQDPARAHAALTEVLAALPEEARAQLVLVMAGQSDPVAPRLTMFWLLDRSAEVRLAAATALLSRANAGQLDARSAALLPALRKWLPAEPARAMVDAAIKAMLRQGVVRADAPAWTIQRCVATLPDGAGAQSIAALVQQGRRRGVALLLLKQGHGVRDAFILEARSARDQQRILEQIGAEIGLVDVEPGFVPRALARALGDGLAHDSLPPPGLLEVAEIWGGEALNPAASDARSILAEIGAGEIAPDEAADSALDLPHFHSWFEDTAELRESLARARGARGRELAAWRFIETRRDWWARQAAIVAATLNASPGAPPELWRGFAASATALLGKAALRDIALMRHVVLVTLEAAGSREAEAKQPAPKARRAAPRREKAGELAGLLGGTGISEAFLQGYLTALAITPRPVSLEAWLGPLLGGIEFRAQGELQRLLDLVMMRANRTDEEAADQAAVAGWIAALDEAGWQAWLRGMAALVEATARAWPSSALSPTDRHVLRDLRTAAKTGESAGLRAVLPAWIAARHGRRR